MKSSNPIHLLKWLRPYRDRGEGSLAAAPIPVPAIRGQTTVAKITVHKGYTMTKPPTLASIALACTLAHASLANAEIIFGRDFQLNGDATSTSSSLQLTSMDILNDRASAFIKAPLALGPTTSFEAHFGFRILGGSGGADGFTFTLQNDVRGVSFIGIEGGNLGFYTIAGGNGNPLPFGPARAVAFDTFPNGNYGDADGNHVSTLDNTTYQLRKQAPAAWDLNSGDELFAWIAYNALAQTLSVYLNDIDSKPATALLIDSMDLHADLGGEAFVGFTAATGGLANAHVITSFSLIAPLAVPEPQTYLLFVLGLGLLAKQLRLRKRRPDALIG